MPTREKEQETPRRIRIDLKGGRVDELPPTVEELADEADRLIEHEAEQAARGKLLGDREAAVATILEAAKADPVAAAVAVLLGVTDKNPTRSGQPPERKP